MSKCPTVDCRSTRILSPLLLNLSSISYDGPFNRSFRLYCIPTAGPYARICHPSTRTWNGLGSFCLPFDSFFLLPFGRAETCHSATIPLWVDRCKRGYRTGSVGAYRPVDSSGSVTTGPWPAPSPTLTTVLGRTRETCPPPPSQPPFTASSVLAATTPSAHSYARPKRLNTTSSEGRRLCLGQWWGRRYSCPYHLDPASPCTPFRGCTAPIGRKIPTLSAWMVQ